MELPEIDPVFLLQFLADLLNTPSPTGFSAGAIDLCEKTLAGFTPLLLQRTRKGVLLAVWGGVHADDTAPRRALTGHVDTLGGMVKEIKPNGRLKLTQLGGWAWNTIEGEGCRVFTRGGAVVRGSVLLNKASGHVYGAQVSETKREADSMEVRLDARTTSAAETRQLGIEVGDFVVMDPRVEITNDFIRSRHLDDKAGVACMLAAVKAIAAAGLRPALPALLHISNYEEVGHGAASGIPASVEELLVVDMAAVGDGQNSDEYHCTLCLKDSGGPYHHEFSRRLQNLADAQQIPYRLDIYPYYGSDGEAFWRAGGDVEVALIGPGVDASHNYERTHLDALLATTRWICAFLLSEGSR